MINSVHALIYAKDAEKVCASFRDILGFPSVDAGGGWLIFALPPAELGIHPAEGAEHDKLYLMCDDIAATVKELKHKGVEVTRPIEDVRWGLVTAIKIPGGAELGVYQPKHPTALGLKR
ncbi:MAG TPA: VOC family protein [Candidatus Acidoferrales bacterium]|nr:VOC family protein [Candidatus Acidoferrales bacterium]